MHASGVCPIVAMANPQTAKWCSRVGVDTMHSPFADGTTRKRVRSSDFHATACAGWEAPVVPASPALVVAPGEGAMDSFGTKDATVQQGALRSIQQLKDSNFF